MKTTEIGGCEISYRYTNDLGDTVRQEMTASDRAYIAQQLQKVEEGTFSSGELKLRWNVVY